MPKPMKSLRFIVMSLVFILAIVGASATADAKRLSILNKDTTTWMLSGVDYARVDGPVIEVGMGDATWGYGFAGVELEGARIMNVKIQAPSRYKHYDANAFAGFMIDYSTSEGYTKRVALGIGMLDRGRWGVAHGWGTGELPSEFIDLGRHSVYYLDLGKWAPPDWDGQVWFSLGIQNAGEGNSLKARLFVR